MQAELEGAGRSPAAFIGSLTGFGTVTLEQARLVGLNPEVFGAVTRAIELGIPTEGNRIREFVAGALDNAGLPVSKASAAISISAGQARLRDIVIKADGADLQATVNVDLADAMLDALLTLNAPPSATGAARPAVMVALKGTLPAPKRTVDINLLTSWLTLRAVEQQSRQIEAMERAARDAAAAAAAAAPPKAADPPELPQAVPPLVPELRRRPRISAPCDKWHIRRSSGSGFAAACHDCPRRRSRGPRRAPKALRRYRRGRRHRCRYSARRTDAAARIPIRSRVTAGSRAIGAWLR